MNSAQDVMSTAQKMLSLYCEGEYQKLWDAYLDPDVLVILPSHAQPLCGRDDLVRYLFRADAAEIFCRHIANMRFEMRRSSADVFIIYGSSADALPQECPTPFSNTPISLSCGFRKTEQGFRLMILHTSIPFSEYSLHRAATDIYGAVFLCAADEPLTLLQMNESFVSLFGYTREEIADRFQNSFLSMVDPRDRHLMKYMPDQTAAIQETEFRFAAKDGEGKWVLARRQLLKDLNGIPYFCCILIDISASKKLQLELAMSLQRHEIILNQTNDIIFEWDIASDHFSFSSNWEKLFHYPPLLGNTAKTILSTKHVHPDDRKGLMNFFHSILQGIPYVECETRIARADGTFLWCRARSTQQFDAKGAPIKAIGVICNIDEEKQRAQKLLEKAERDTLTGLYNKGTVQSLIAEHLASRHCDGMDALLIIDIDNFKSVNDTEGHLFGDNFLNHVAMCLNKIFRSTDLIGRIGGDEFIVLAKDIPEVGLVRQKAEQALQAFHMPQTSEKRRIAVSCSIGIAIADRPSMTLEALYSNADWALYQAKRGGKNRYMLYEGDDSPALRSGYTSLAKELNG